jgi:hypothetical protein
MLVEAPRATPFIGAGATKATADAWIAAVEAHAAQDGSGEARSTGKRAGHG